LAEANIAASPAAPSGPAKPAPEVSRQIALPRPLDLDDVGAEVRQHLGGEGRGEDMAEIEDPYSVERAALHGNRHLFL
jgi:hypothetical protein